MGRAMEKQPSPMLLGGGENGAAPPEENLALSDETPRLFAL